MNKLTRTALIAAAFAATAVAVLPAQAGHGMFTENVIDATGHYFVNAGGDMLEQIRKELAAGMTPAVQRLPSVTVTPTDQELRDAGLDPREFRAAHARKAHQAASNP